MPSARAADAAIDAGAFRTRVIRSPCAILKERRPIVRQQQLHSRQWALSLPTAEEGALRSNDAGSESLEYGLGVQ